MLQPRAAWSTMPPAARDRMQNQPTLLFSWWCTTCSAVVILLRICGRKIRSNELSREDWIMLAALVPLFVRMVFVDFVLRYRTNNVDMHTAGYLFTPEEIYFRSIGSKLVLPGRIFYAMFIWFCKLTVSEFLKRITIRIWRPTYEMTLRGIRIFLLLTFGAVVVATLAECHPFPHYWQVIPDPGAHCRLGYAHLFTMGICDIITDFLLILFPIPIVLMSGQTWRRKLQLVSLFSLSVIMIAITVTRMTMVVRHQGLQQYRTVWASCEILASAATCNAVVLGSFVRGKGTRKNRYVSHSVSDSIDRVSTRRPTMCSYGSDEDLFRSVGCRLPEDLEAFQPSKPRPAPPASPGIPSPPIPTFAPKTLAPVHRTTSREYGDASVHGFVLGRVLPSPSISTSGSGSTIDKAPASEEDGFVQKRDGSWGMKRPPRVRARSSDASVATYDFASPSSSRTRPLIHPDSPDELPHIPSRRRESLSQRSFRLLQRSFSNQSRVSSPPTGVHGPVLERQEIERPLQDAGRLLQFDSRSSVAWDYFQPWPEPGDDSIRSVTDAPANWPGSVQTPTLEDVGGLLSGVRQHGANVGTRERTTFGRRLSSPAMIRLGRHRD